MTMVTFASIQPQIQLQRGAYSGYSRQSVRKGCTVRRLLVAFLVVIAAFGESSLRKYTAFDVAAIFADNEVKGEQMFRDRVQIDGVINNIETGTVSGAYVELIGPTLQGGVTCVIESEHVSQLLPLHRGQRVTVSGQRARRHLGQVFFHECQFVSFYVPPPPPPPAPTVAVGILTPQPEYTKEALAAHLQGTVLMHVTLGVDGHPRDVYIMHRRIGGGLDEQAVKAVKGWLFKPATENGNPVESEFRVTTEFKLY
jgi:TonB family protein